MRRFALSCIGALIAIPAFGQSLLDCIDQDVLRGLLLGQADQTLTASATVPPELATFKAPAQLTWIGAAERSSNLSINGSSMATTTVSAVYRTGLAPDAARDVAAAAMVSGGWKLRSDQGIYGVNVFTSGNSPSPGADTYCREGQPVSVAANALDGVTYVVLGIPRTARNNPGMGNACDQAPQMAIRPVSALDQYLPKLELPRDPATGQPVQLRGGGAGSSGMKRRADASFVAQGSLEDVAAHFARQMAAQGWSRDTSWSGSGTAGSTWIRKPDADMALQGTLSISAFDDNRFAAQLRIVQTK